MTKREEKEPLPYQVQFWIKQYFRKTLRIEDINDSICSMEPWTLELNCKHCKYYSESTVEYDLSHPNASKDSDGYWGNENNDSHCMYTDESTPAGENIGDYTRGPCPDFILSTKYFIHDSCNDKPFQLF